MKKKILILIVPLVFMLQSIVSAGDCVEIGEDIIETWIELDCNGMKPGDVRTKISNGVKVTYTKQADGTVKTLAQSNLAIQSDSLLTNGDVFNDHEVSDTHTGTGDKIDYAGDNLGTTDKMTVGTDGKGFSVESTATPSKQTMTTAILNEASLRAGEGSLDTSDPAAVKDFLVNQGHKPGTTAYNKLFNRIQGKDSAGLTKEANKFKGDEVVIIAMKFKVPRTQICKEETPTKPCDVWNSLGQPAPVTCKDGQTGQGFRAQCTPSDTKTQVSSFTTTSKNFSDPMIRNRDICDAGAIAEGKKPMDYILSKAGNIKANSQVMQDKLSSLPKLFNENHWSTKWKYESRFWNPFQEGVIVPGLPFKEHFSPTLDSWKSNVAKIDSDLKESIQHVADAEKINNNFANNYGGRDLKLYTNVPNPTIKFRYLDNGKWKEDSSKAKECISQYELKVFPRLDITVHKRYQKYKWNHTDESSWTYSCDCKAIYERKWDRQLKRYVRVFDRWDCDLDRVDLGGVNVKVPNGEEQDTSPGGSIPPVYEGRVIWRYRIGTDNEFHSYAENLTTPKLKAIPSNSTTKIKSGYGANYSGDKYKVITDYDVPQFKTESDLVRPNKQTPIVLSNSLKAQTKEFDPNVKYDRAKDAPEKSSSKDSTFIQERINGTKIKSNFRKDAISRFVSSSLSGSYGSPKQVTGNTSISGGEIFANGSKIDMSTTFESKSGNKYYHSYWVTKGHPNLIPAFKPGPLHYINLDYPSGSMYDIYSMNRVIIRDGFTIDTFNKGSIKVLGNMWEDSFSRPDSEKNITYIYI